MIELPRGPSFEQVKRGTYIFIGAGCQQQTPPRCSSLRPQPSFPIHLCLNTLPMHTPLAPSCSVPVHPPPFTPTPPFSSSHTKVSCLPHIVRAWVALEAGSVHPSPFSAPLCHSSGLIQSLIRKEEEKDKATVGSAPSGLPLFTTSNSCFTKETMCHLISVTALLAVLQI